MGQTDRSKGWLSSNLYRYCRKTGVTRYIENVTWASGEWLEDGRTMSDFYYPIVKHTHACAHTRNRAGTVRTLIQLENWFSPGVRIDYHRRLAPFSCTVQHLQRLLHSHETRACVSVATTLQSDAYVAE